MQVKMVDTEKIKPSPFQTRGNFDEEDLKGLAETYERRGIIDPLSVRPRDNSYFELISGERRLRAAKIAGLKKVPCMVKELSDKDARYENLIENIQRKNLDPLGRAQAIDSLMKTEDWKTQREAARKIGMNEVTLGRWIAVLKMPVDIQKKITNVVISDMKIQRIAGLSSDEDKRIVFEKVVEKELSQKRVFEIVNAFKEIDSDLTFTAEEKEKVKKKVIEAEEFIESPKSIIANMKWQKEHPKLKNLPTVGEFALTLATKMGDIVRDLEDLAKNWGYLGEGGREAILSHLEELNEIRKQLKKEVVRIEAEGSKKIEEGE